MANAWNNWSRKADTRIRLTHYVVGLGVGLIVGSLIAGYHPHAKTLLTIIGLALVVAALLTYSFRRKSA